MFIYRSKTHNTFLNLKFENNLFIQKIKKKSKHISLLFYENKDSIIVGKSLDIEKEIYIHKKNPIVLRRNSGGGTVVHFTGNLNYSIMIPLEKYPELLSIQDSYQIILKVIRHALKPNIQLYQKGISDLCIFENNIYKKISGNAQIRKKHYLLHHGTIIYDTKNINKINYFLRHPLSEPDYREKRNHLDFIPRKIKLNKYKIQQQIIHSFKDYFL